MNKLFTKIATLSVGLAMAIGVGVAVNDGSKDSSVKAADATGSLTITRSCFPSGSLAYNVTDAWSATCAPSTDGSVSGQGDLYSTAAQTTMQTKNSGVSTHYHNTTAMPGYITGITLELASGTNRTYTVRASKSSAITSTSGGTQLGTMTAGSTFTTNLTKANDYRYFWLTCGGGASFLNNIVINYSVPEKLTVTCNANNATSGSVPTDSTKYNSGASVTVKGNTGSLARTGYTFGGWNTQADGNGTNYAAGSGTFSISANTTLYAKWTANQYNINYYDQGGSAFSGSHESGYPTKHTYGTATTLKSATRGGYSFDGWFTDSGCTGSAVTSLGATAYTAAINLYAKWTATGTTYSISTTVTNGSYTGDTTITDNGGVASVTISPTGDYKLPASVSVSGADHTYNSSTGVISLSNATGNVTISASMVALAEYTITVNETNGSHTGASTIKESRSASLTFTPDSGFGQPSTVTVSGATSSWTRGTGVLSLSNPTGNVTVTYAAVGNELDSITISANSGNYTLGDAFIKPTVTAHYTVAADANVTSSATYSGYDPYTTGNQNVTISYTEGGITKTESYTANVSAASVETITTWELTDLADLTSTDEFVIARTSSTTVALPSNGGASRPTVSSVTISNNKITSAVTDSLKWNVSGNASDGYVFYPNGSTSTWLYLLDDNNDGVRIGSGANAANKHFTLEQGYLYTEETTYPRMVGVYNDGDWRCYKLTSGGEPGANIAGQTFGFFKKVETQVGEADLIRITATYKGGDKYVGDSISTSDFTVKKQLNTGNELIDVASGYTISANTLTSTSNTITVSYTENNITKTADVVVSATERSATVTSVTLVQGAGVVKNYVDWSGSAWNYTDLTVHCAWSDSTFNEDLSLADLVQSGDATVSPSKPAVGVTSFTVTYTYHEVSMTSNTVSDINVVADYVASVSWSGKSLANFKSFSGGQLTSSIVSGWIVKATYAGAGETDALSFGTGANQFTIRIGDSKSITSLPYTWQSEDDNQFIYVVVGGVAKGDSTYAKANICATINDIDHTESETIIVPVFEYTLATSVPSMSTGDTKQVVVAANVNGTYYAMDAISSNKGQNYTPTVTNGVISDEDASYVWTLTKTSTGYTLSDENGKITTGTNTNISTSSNGTDFSIISGTKGTFRITPSSGSNRPLIYRASTYNVFGGYAASNVTAAGTEYYDLELFVGANTGSKEETVETTVHYANQMEHFDAQKKVVEFAKFMNTTMNGTNVCSGTFANLESAWDDVADKYDELFGASTTLNETELAWAKNMLKYATAAWGSDAEAACVEKAVKTYEFCVDKYDLDPFMDGVRSAGKNSINPIDVLSSSSNTALIIVLVSAVSLAAIGGYFFLRKKKED